MAYATRKPKSALYHVVSGKTHRVVARTKKLTTARKRAAGLLRRGSKRVSIVRGGKVFSLAAARKRRRSSKAKGRRTTARRTSRKAAPRRSSKRRSSARRSSKRRVSKSRHRRSSRRRSSRRRSSKR